MSSSTIRIDSLVYSLRELQTEKQCLEHKLKERKFQAQAVEKRVEKCNAKLRQMQEMHHKLSEMQKVAVQKVQQTQEQVDSLHELNQAQSNKLNELNSIILQEKNRRLANVNTFEKKMNDLAKKLITARKFYKADTLQERIKDTSGKIRENEAAAQTDSKEVVNLTSTMDNLQLTAPDHCMLDRDVPHNTRLMIWSMLEKEEQKVKSSLQRLQAEQQEIWSLLQESTTSLHGYSPSAQASASSIQ